MNAVRTLTAAIAALGLGAATGYGFAQSGSTQTGATPAASTLTQAATGPETQGRGMGQGHGRGHAAGSTQHGGQDHPRGQAGAHKHGAGQGEAGAHGHDQAQGMSRGMGQGMHQGMGQGMGMGGMMGRFQNDPAGQADMGLVQTMVHGHESITRSVTDLPDGIRTLTESSDSQVAGALQAHVASMMQRLDQGKEFNLFSETIPVLFANRDRIVTRFEMTPRGASVVQTSTDPAVVAALQTHAKEVSELASEGPAAMQRNMQRRMSSVAGPAAPAAGAPLRTASRPANASAAHDHGTQGVGARATHGGHTSHGAPATSSSRASMQASMHASMHAGHAH